MNVAPVHSDVRSDVLTLKAPVARPPLGPSAETPASFVNELDTQQAAGSAREREARQVAEQLVATTFIEPVLEMLRDTNQAAGPFAPGTTERRFTPMLDQQLSERIVHGARFPLVDRITENLLRADPVRGDDWQEARENRHAAS